MENVIDFRQKKFEKEGKKVAAQIDELKKKRLEECRMLKDEILGMVSRFSGEDIIRLKYFRDAVEGAAFELLQNDIMKQADQ